MNKIPKPLNNIDNRGFTLVELLTVISIISLITVVVVGSFQDAKEKANYAAAEADMRRIAEAITIARGASALSLGQITGEWCSSCVCRDSYSGMDSNVCINRQRNSQDAVEARSHELIGDISSYRDPWGNPYMIDENYMEATFGSNPAITNDCRQDWVRSAGKDGRHEGGGPTGVNVDDIILFIKYPNNSCP